MLSNPYTQFILDKTEGNPFFMEEIVQTLREQGIPRRRDAPQRVSPKRIYVSRPPSKAC